MKCVVKSSCSWGNGLDEQLKRVLCKVFEMDEEEITDDMSPERVPLWDSLHHLKMVTVIEGVYQIQLTMKEIRSMTTFGRIREVLHSRLAGTGMPGQLDKPEGFLDS